MTNANQLSIGDRKWSPMQEAVFEDARFGSGHTSVRARAGSGKTSVIVESFKHVPRGCSTLMVAFNKSIADELKTRAPRSVTVQTLHGYGFATVMRAIGKLEVDQDRTDSIIRGLVGAERKDSDRRYALKKVVSFAKNTLTESAEDLDVLVDAYDLDIVGDRDEFFGQVVQVLERCKDVGGSIDFDDMIWLPHALNLHPRSYDRVFIDELQDLNTAQIDLALKAADSFGGRICAVGDPAQAIYQFRGADAGAFENVVSRLGAKILPLSITYRCAKAVVDVAREVVPDFEAAPDAAEGEVHRGVSELSMLQDVVPGDFILSRTNAPLIGFCLSLLRKGVPATIQGRDVAQQLMSFVQKSGASTVDALLKHVEKWREREVERLVSRDPPRETRTVEDKAAMFRALAEGAQSVRDVEDRIQRLFGDGAPTGRVVLSTTHKAKGLERDRVFVLESTYRKWPGTQEDNLWYTAITRARRDLRIVTNVKTLP